MRRFSLLAALLCAATCFAYTLSGTVTDEQHAPLAGVTVAVPAIKRGTVSATDGAYLLQNLPAGVYTVEISLIGYRRETRTVNVATHDTLLNVKLFESPLEFPPVTVTAAPQPVSVQRAAQSATVIEGRQLDRQRRQTAIETIESEPGVAVFSTGIIAKPVIRGLSGARVLVVTDGIRQEGQQWGDEHAPELDALDIDRIEIVRGPNSVLYGSDALGGVVNIIKAEIPSPDKAPCLAGLAQFNAFSGNEQAAGSLGLFGASGKIGYRANLSARNAEDTRTPEGKLFNSGAREVNGSGLLGIYQPWGTGAVDFSHVGQELEIHEDPAEGPTATPFQKVNHDRLHVHTNFPGNDLRLEVDGGWQRNVRKEFEEASATDPAVHLKLDTWTTDARAHHAPKLGLIGTVGASFMAQSNETLGEEWLIPAFDLWNGAGYLYEEWQSEKLTLSGGGRFDLRSLTKHEDVTRQIAEETRDYSTATGTFGASWRVTEPLAFVVSVGRAWRAPTPFELFADGVHEGTIRYEVGDASLEPEASLNVEANARCYAPRLQGELAVYRNTIDKYIYGRPTGEIDPGSGYEIFRNSQADAVLHGGEFSLDAHAVDFLIISAGADIVRGENTAANSPLPLMPADRARLGFRLIQPRLGIVWSPYISLSATAVADQKRLDLHETATPGYTLFDAGIGGELLAGGRRVTVDVSFKNLLDRNYRSHLSRYKAYAPDPGRSVSLKVGVPFTVVK